MTFEVEINGRLRSVTVERSAGGLYHVVIDSVPHEVDAVRVGMFGLSLVLNRETGESREIQVAPATVPGEFLVTLDGRVATATINRRRTGRGDAADHASGEQAIVAPMPGRVVRVLVTAGDEVAARQPVIVVEAMKMENELRSPKAGRVKEVAVTPGTSVDAGRVLVVVE